VVLAGCEARRPARRSASTARGGQRRSAPTRAIDIHNLFLVGTLVKTRIAGLDEVLLGGVPRHNNLIVEGAPGSGKTTPGLGCIYAGAADYDEAGRGVHVYRRAPCSRTTSRPRTMERGELFIHYASPLELERDVHFDRIIKLVEKEGIDCVVFDSCAVYEMTSPDEAADYPYALANFFKNRLATVFFNYESPELLGLSQISHELKGSHLVDNIILLNYVDISTVLRRAIAIPKVRGSRTAGHARIRHRRRRLAAGVDRRTRADQARRR
jgi:circadian clock protein KaiC